MPDGLAHHEPAAQQHRLRHGGPGRARPDSNGHRAHSGGEYHALRSSVTLVPSGAVSREV
nr:hypothetical protein GCM10020093_032240 [Planobispora longispora]